MSDIITFFESITVKIINKKELSSFLGTGFFYKANKKLYIITCAHVLDIGDESMRDTKRGLLDLSNINIKYGKKELKLLKVLTPFNEPYTKANKDNDKIPDIIAIEVFATEELCHSIEDYFLWNNHCEAGVGLYFFGYPQASGDDSSRLYLEDRVKYLSLSEERCDKFYLDIDYIHHDEDKYAIQNLQGVSGGPVFYKYEDEWLCLGVFTGSPEKNGNTYRGRGISIRQLSSILEIGLGYQITEYKPFIPTLKKCRDQVVASIESIGKRYITHYNEEYKPLNTETNTGRLLRCITNTTIFSLKNWGNGWIKYIDDFMVTHAKHFKAWDRFKNDKTYRRNKVEMEVMEKNLKDISGIVFRNDSIEMLKNLFTDLSNGKNLQSQYSYHKLLMSLNSMYKNIPSILETVTNIHPEKLPQSIKFIRSLAENHVLKDLIYELNEFITYNKVDYELTPLEINDNNRLTTALFRCTLVSGHALTGKTHTLCDYSFKRVNGDNIQPTILLFGHQFLTSECPISQIQRFLKLEECHLTNDDFLYILNCWGEKENELVSIVVDAINESSHSEVWRNYYENFVDKIRKFPFLSLIISVRTTEKDKVFTGASHNGFFIPEIIHNGFENELGKVFPKFCNYFGVNIENVANSKFNRLRSYLKLPGILFLFFETLKKQNLNRIPQDFLVLDFLIKIYLKDINTRFKKNKPEEKAHYVNIGLDIVAKEIVKNFFDEEIKYDNVFVELKRVHEKLLLNLISEDLFIVVDSFDISGETSLKFTYQWISNYIIARFIIKDIRTRDFDFKNALSTSKEIRFLIERFFKSESIIEALIVQLRNQYEIDLFELLEIEDESENFLVFEINTCINNGIVTNRVEQLYKSFPQVEHGIRPLLFQLLLKGVLDYSSDKLSSIVISKLKEQHMGQRDAWWNALIIGEYEEYNSLIGKYLNHLALESDTLELDTHEQSILFAWFLNSTNRVIRDKSTKVLVKYFINNLQELCLWLKHFRDVDDLYIKERIWCISYGAVLRSSQLNGLDLLCKYAYLQVFESEEIIPHILLRDYSRWIIEFGVSKGITDTFDMRIIRPPYKSTFPGVVSDEYISNLKISYSELPENTYKYSQNDILESMQVQGKGIMYGDFGRYIYQHFVSLFDVNAYEMMKISIKRIFDMGYNVELHGKFDKSIYSNGRAAKKEERIGKKYQWIALHEILAYLVDNNEMKGDYWSEEPGEFDGAYQIGIRDIDPTLLMYNTKSTGRLSWSPQSWFQKHTVDFSDSPEKEKKKWLWNNTDIPQIKDLLVYEDINQESWLNIAQYLSWREESEVDLQKEVHCSIKSCIIKNDDIMNISEYIRTTNRSNYNELDIRYDYNYFLAEYPWHPMFDGYKEYNRLGPFDVYFTCQRYLWDSDLDGSIEDSIGSYLPAPWLMNKMKLHLGHCKNIEYHDTNNNCVFYDPSIEEGGIETTLIKKESLLESLKDEDMTIAWFVMGEKNLFPGNFNRDDWMGQQIIRGFFYYEDGVIKGGQWCEESRPKG